MRCPSYICIYKGTLSSLVLTVYQSSIVMQLKIFRECNFSIVIIFLFFSSNCRRTWKISEDDIVWFDRLNAWLLSASCRIKYGCPTHDERTHINCMCLEYTNVCCRNENRYLSSKVRKFFFWLILLSFLSSVHFTTFSKYYRFHYTFFSSFAHTLFVSQNLFLLNPDLHSVHSYPPFSVLFHYILTSFIFLILSICIVVYWSRQELL